MRVVEVSSGPLKVVLIPFREIKKIFTYRRTYNRYIVLKREIDTLRRSLLEQEEIIREHKRYEDLLRLKKDFVFSALAANVVARDPSSWSSAVIIDKGKSSGIEKGMPVISGVGVVGKVIEVGESVSKVMLLTDPRFSVAALIQRNREQGLVSGSLQGYARMQQISAEADIQIGDHVITSKLSSFFPGGLLLGKVVDVREGLSSPTLECLIEPAVRLSQIEEVLVIKRQPRE